MAPLLRIALSSFAAVPLVSATVLSFDSVRKDATSDFIPNAAPLYVEHAGSSARIQNSSSSNIAQPHEEFYDHLNKRGVTFRTTKEWSVRDVFIGVSISMDRDSDLSQVVKTPGVKSIQPVRLYRRPEPVNISGPETYNSNASPHTLTGVDALHKEGILGAGVTVAIIDTGVDYNHPVLGGGIGPGKKVPGGYDFVGDAFNGTNTPVPDPDPMDCNSRGTHVAGIVAASGPNSYNITGVAPQANLRAYRIFGCQGSTTDEIIIDALLLGYKDKVDVMNLSLGGPADWTVSQSSIIASRLADKGIPVAIAAGNDGTQGAWWASSPGSGVSVTTAASTDNTVFYLATATTSTGYGPIGYSSLEPFQWPTFPIYTVSTDIWPDISSSSASFVQKLTNLAAKGAKYALIYNNGGAFGTPSTSPYISAMINEQDGAYLVSQFAAGNNITVSFPQSLAKIFPNPEGGVISSFTSYGPTYDLYLKPSVAAPGGNILSSIPNNQYAVYSGTSMATPYIAGSAALILSTKGKRASIGKAVKKYLQTTAKYWNVFHIIEIENTSFKRVTYTLSHTPAGTAITSDGLLPIETVALITSSLKVNFSQEKITVWPKSKGCVVVTVDKPENDKTLPVYSGWVTITASTGEVLSVPYMGVATSMKDVQIIDNSDFYFGIRTPVVLDGNGAPQTGPLNYTFSGSNHPFLVWRRAAGTARQIVDLVPANIDLKPTYERRAEWEEFEKRSWWGSWFPWWNPNHGGTYAKAVVGTLIQEEWLYRHAVTGTAGLDYESLDLAPPLLFANGTAIPKGMYRFLLRVLKITGDPTREKDYETYLSPVVGVYPST